MKPKIDLIAQAEAKRKRLIAISVVAGFAIIGSVGWAIWPKAQKVEQSKSDMPQPLVSATKPIEDAGVTKNVAMTETEKSERIVALKKQWWKLSNLHDETEKIRVYGETQDDRLRAVGLAFVIEGKIHEVERELNSLGASRPGTELVSLLGGKIDGKKVKLNLGEPLPFQLDEQRQSDQVSGPGSLAPARRIGVNTARENTPIFPDTKIKSQSDADQLTQKEAQQRAAQEAAKAWSEAQAKADAERKAAEEVAKKKAEQEKIFYTSAAQLLADMPRDKYPKFGPEFGPERADAKTWLQKNLVGKNIQWSSKIEEVTLSVAGQPPGQCAVSMAEKDNIDARFGYVSPIWDMSMKLAGERLVVFRGASGVGPKKCGAGAFVVDIETAKKLRDKKEKTIVVQAKIREFRWFECHAPIYRGDIRYIGVGLVTTVLSIDGIPLIKPALPQ